MSNTITFSSDDSAMERAHKLLTMTGLVLRADEIGELMQRRAAEVIEIYRKLDAEKSNNE